MKTLIMIAIAATTFLSSCESTKVVENPFFATWSTPFGVPPFDQIKAEHYLPAIEEGMKLEKAEIDAIINNPDVATFENTIAAYDSRGEFLNKVSSVLGCITATDITPELEEIQAQVSRLATTHSSDISLNPMLFSRIKAVYDGRQSAGLDSVQLRLLDKIYKGFERSGATLSDGDKAKLREIDSKLSSLSLAFGKNLRNDNGNFCVLVDNLTELKGLPSNNITAAASEAKARNNDGKWAFTLDKPSMIPLLQYAENRELRKKLYMGYLERCNNNDENDNKAVIDSMVNLKLERANLMGFPTAAAFIIDRNMAKSPEAVYALLEELWTPALKRAAAEKAEMQAIMNAEGVAGNIELWDWWFYAEKLRAQKYALNEEELRPYFSLNNVRDGIFNLTTKLYGITYKDITKQVPLYAPENQVFEVIDKDGSHLGVVYFDFHPRKSKSVGAWCTRFRGQSYKDGEKITPIVSVVCNFTKPNGDEPALLNLDETETFFHEYGHGLHSLFANVKYRGLGGVERDFVELPSQIMENWAFEPSMLRNYAKHYKTGETIPDDLIEKIQKSALFNQGFATVEYLGASLLDMDFHTVNTPGAIDVPSFEKASLAKFGAMPEIAPRYRSTYFKHIFNGGYSAGYYVYIWAEVLDSDAFAAFQQSGDIYNPELAERFRKEVLSQGGSADGTVLYHNFRGQEPSKQPLMERRGLN